MKDPNSTSSIPIKTPVSYAPGFFVTTTNAAGRRPPGRWWLSTAGGTTTPCPVCR